MPTTKKGQKVIRVVVEEDSELLLTLLEWAEKRGLTSAKATRCILADWTDAINGKPNPFGISISNSGQPVLQLSPVSAEPELSAEEKARQEALQQAAEQFL